MKKYIYRYVAYDAANGEYDVFETVKEASDWLKENDGKGISPEACDGDNWIAEIQYKSVVSKIEDRSDYCECDLDKGDCTCGKDEWPFNEDFGWIATHTYEKINYDDENK